MRKVILLDSTPLGLLANPGNKPVVLRCRRWAADLAAAGHRVIVPEIADYEVRRSLLRAGLMTSVRALDDLALQYGYLTLNTDAMKLAAQLWAVARQRGYPTAPDSALDGDVILAAQALELNDPNVVIATGNPAHLSRYVPAQDWQAVTP